MEGTGSDAWGEQHVPGSLRGCTVHWGPKVSKKLLEVVLAAASEVAAGMTLGLEATAGRVRAYVADAIGGSD